MVTRFGNGYFKEVGIYQHSGGTHKSTPTVSIDTYFVDIDKPILIGQLFNHCLFIG